MQILQTFLLIVAVCVCMVLILLILLQSDKSGGGLGLFGGASSATPFGASTTDIITKLTWWLVGIFFIFAILTAVAFSEGGPQLEAQPANLGPSPGDETEDGNGKSEKIRSEENQKKVE